MTKQFAILIFATALTLMSCSSQTSSHTSREKNFMGNYQNSLQVPPTEVKMKKRKIRSNVKRQAVCLLQPGGLHFNTFKINTYKKVVLGAVSQTFS